jgi:hypothetical protein
LRAWDLVEVWRGLLDRDSDNIKNLPLGAFYLSVSLSPIRVNVLRLPVLDYDFSTLGRPLAEYLLDLLTSLLDGLHKRRNHFRQLKAIVLMRHADKRRFEGGEN